MLGLVTPFACVVQRRNPARISQRNLRIVQGEAFVLQCTIYNQDTDTAPANVGGVAPVFSIFRDHMEVHSGRGYGACGYGAWNWGDYGWGYDVGAVPVLTITGVVASDPTTGLVSFAFPSAETAPLGGRYRFYLYDMTSETVLATGILQVDGSRYAQPGILGVAPVSGETAPLDVFTLDQNVLQ